VQARNLILPAIGVAVAAALILLFLQVKDSPAHEVDEAKLAAARAQAKRSAPVTNTPTSPSSSGPGIPKPTRIKPPTTKPAPPDEPDQKVFERDEPVIQPSTEPTDQKKIQMDAANRAYDRADYEGALETALEVLKDNPRNIRMLRVVVSSACIMADGDQAREWYDKLPGRDQRQMSIRCKRYGVEFDK
jgi:hypothetical protein